MTRAEFTEDEKIKAAEDMANAICLAFEVHGFTHIVRVLRELVDRLERAGWDEIERDDPR